MFGMQPQQRTDPLCVPSCLLSLSRDTETEALTQAVMTLRTGYLCCFSSAYDSAQKKSNRPDIKKYKGSDAVLLMHMLPNHALPLCKADVNSSRPFPAARYISQVRFPLAFSAWQLRRFKV